MLLHLSREEAAEARALMAFTELSYAMRWKAKTRVLFFHPDREGLHSENGVRKPQRLKIRTPEAAFDYR